MLALVPWGAWGLYKAPAIELSGKTRTSLIGLSAFLAGCNLSAVDEVFRAGLEAWLGVFTRILIKYPLRGRQERLGRLADFRFSAGLCRYAHRRYPGKSTADLISFSCFHVNDRGLIGPLL